MDHREVNLRMRKLNLPTARVCFIKPTHHSKLLLLHHLYLILTKHRPLFFLYTSFHPQGHNPNFGHRCLMLALLQEMSFLEPKFVNSICYVKPSNGFPLPLAIKLLKMPYEALRIGRE